jgi:hypothetical protein
VPVPSGIAALIMKSFDDAVEDQPVVEAIARELAEVLDRLGGVVIEEADGDRAGIRVEGGLRHAL